MALLVNSGPLSITNTSGRPVNWARSSSTRVTRWPEMEVSTAMTGHSRLKSSTTVKARNRRPSLRLSWMKSRDHPLQGTSGRCHWHDPAPTASQLFASLGQLQPFLGIQPLYPLVVDDSQFLA